MDGFALQAKLQEHKDTRATPFIFLTAKADDQSRQKGMRTGVDDYITKPFDIEQLLTRIERLLERTKLFQTQLDAKIGHDFSQKLLPKKLPEVNGYDVAFFNRPREHGGGDLFDWTEVQTGIYLFTIGDVMGKGLQAKFYAFSFLSYVRGTLHAMLRATLSPAELMKRLNQVLMQDTVMEDTFASLLLLRWEPAKHEITYVNAGHCRPLLVSPRGAEIVAYSDLILNLDPETEFTDTTINIEPGCAFVGYTDGLLEQPLDDHTLVGEEGIKQIAAAASREPDPIAFMLSTVMQRSEAPEFTDDVLVFWLQRND
jgi:sigma-B regulation protein RsbU (phosphoserine phosphatase)